MSGGAGFVYRDIGPRSGVPLILLNHWGAVLDNFDPRIVDGLASKRRVIATNYRGIGASGGTAPVTIDEMARDAIALIGTLGFEKVDLLGFSLGGFVAQDIPTENSTDMARRIPDSQLVIYEDAGHGGIFQNHAEFVQKALSFLEA
jgi:pimeloyl-ACP methyl ester carboxylesterase